MLLLYLLTAANAQLAAECETGEHLIDGVNVGASVTMDYTSTSVSFDYSGEQNQTTLNMVFNVPTLYFYQEQTLGTEDYNRSVSITFHDRTDSSASQDACFSNRYESSNCDGANALWSTAENSCNTVVTGGINFGALLESSEHDLDNMYIDGDTDDASWSIYLTAQVETWAGFSQQSDLAGTGDLDFNNPDHVQNLASDHLTITDERYTFYYIPFRVVYPKQIELTSTSVQSNAALLTLAAIVVQKTLEIDFTPSTQYFALGNVDIATQVQYPYILRDDSDSDAPVILDLVTGDVSDVSITGMTGETTCQSNVENGYCEQTVSIQITPNLCDISTCFDLQFWAKCQTASAAECALDTLGTAPDVGSNGYSGRLSFCIQAQTFCPQVLDEVAVTGSIAAWADADLTETAVEGTNVFSNDHIYFEATFVTSSAKNANGQIGDTADSLISFVRPIGIYLDVTLTETPLQYTVDTSFGDITGTATAYTVTLCEVGAYDPITDANNDLPDCLASANLGTTAETLMEMRPIVIAESFSVNSVDADEIAFGLRLDERVIPVDIPNSPAALTLKMDVEVFYEGVDNPSRRTLAVGQQRRRLTGMGGERITSLSYSTSVSKPMFAYCILNPNLQYTGFKISMAQETYPTEATAADFVLKHRYEIARYLGADWTKISVYRVDNCLDDNCDTVYPVLSGKSNGYNNVQLYVELRDTTTATTLQTDLFYAHDTHVWEDGANVVDLTTDHCDSDLMDTFNIYRQTDASTEEDSNSVATLGAFFATLLLLLAY